MNLRTIALLTLIFQVGIVIFEAMLFVMYPGPLIALCLVFTIVMTYFTGAWREL